MRVEITRNDSNVVLNAVVSGVTKLKTLSNLLVYLSSERIETIGNLLWIHSFHDLNNIVWYIDISRFTR